MAQQVPNFGETVKRLGLGAGMVVGLGAGLPLARAFDAPALGVGVGLALGTVVMVAFHAAGSHLRRQEVADAHAHGRQQRPHTDDPARPFSGDASSEHPDAPPPGSAEQ